MTPSIDRDWIRVGSRAAGFALLAATLALLFVSIGGSSGAGEGDAIASAPVTAVSAPAIAARHESAGSPFPVAGATLIAQGDPAGGWTRAARAGAVAPSQRLIVAALLQLFLMPAMGR